MTHPPRSGHFLQTGFTSPKGNESFSSETIAAVSTPAGRSAIGLIRLTGPKTFEILKRIFKPRGKSHFPSHLLAFPGVIFDPETNSIIDTVLLTTFKGPASFTGEDLAEIGAHGNPVVLTAILSLLFKLGIVPAEPGEFTRRAFLNGKMDLLDVEATSQVLTATSHSQALIALNQMEGMPSVILGKLRTKLIDYLTQVEAGINFPEDAIDEIDTEKMRRDLNEIILDLDRFHKFALQGSLVASGLQLVLIGKPNAGKSSILNAVLGRERAIVTDIPGTTRDTLEETWTVSGFPVKLIDTAGIRKPGDKLEELGIDRTKKAIDGAFLLLAVFDASQPESPEDLEVLQLMRSSGKPALAVLNKCDLEEKFQQSVLADIHTVRTSAISGEGVDDLLNSIETMINKQGLSHLSDLILLGAQQTDALAKALASLKNIHENLPGMYHDLLSIDLSDAVRNLGKVTGETIDVDTLNLIFEKFCIGK